MNSLPQSDVTHLQTAQALLQQNQSEAAGKVLTLISPEQQQHPDVLELHWEIFAQTGRWEAALKAAESLRASNGDQAHALLCTACSLTELGRISEAFETLKDAHHRFPDQPAIAYNLACCSCKLGLVEEAKEWLNKAIATGGRAEVKLMALSDPDFAPLLDFLCAL